MSIKNDNINEMRKSVVAKQTFEAFLKKYKVGDKDIKTHYAFGAPWGKFNIPDDAEEEFFEVYNNAMQRGIEMHIVEKPKELGPLLIDIDFHYDQTIDERIYATDDITYVIGNVNKVIMNYYKWTEKNLLAFVFEKENATEKIDSDGNPDYKDGFHLVYPFMCMSQKMRF